MSWTFTYDLKWSATLMEHACRLVRMGADFIMTDAA